MGMIGIPFRVDVKETAEYTPQTEPGAMVTDLSRLKAAAVAADEEEGCIILGADTIVWQDRKALGKPADREEARKMILMLQGREHSVFTGVTVLKKHGASPEGYDILSQFFCETKVYVHRMSEEEIEAYLDTGEAYDKAGAYGIQGAFGIFVDRIEGDYNNVVGLPVAGVYQALREAGVIDAASPADREGEKHDA